MIISAQVMILNISAGVSVGNYFLDGVCEHGSYFDLLFNIAGRKNIPQDQLYMLPKFSF